MKYKNNYLDSLWSLAVRRKFHNRCALCMSTDGLEAHHYVHRGKNWKLRWDIENGVALCKACHDLADTLYYKQNLAGIMNINYLLEVEVMYRFKDDVLKATGQSEKEYRAQVAKELRETYC